MRPVAHICSDFPTKFGIPRQSGLVDDLTATVVFEPEFREPEALRGIEGFSHLWLIWEFSQARRQEWSPTVRPPRLGGNIRLGVFATRSPFRPNPIGLSCVKLAAVERVEGLGTVLRVTGADLMDGTPIYDIKPYLPQADCHPDATGGFADETALYALEVDFPPALMSRLPESRREAARLMLAQDPRPGYKRQDERPFGVAFAGFDIRFTVHDGVLRVHDVVRLAKEDRP